MSDRVFPSDPLLRFAIFLIALILTFVALKLGQNMFAPLLLALVTGVILGPFTDFLQRLHVPVVMAATSVLLIGIASIAVLSILAEPLIWQIIDQMPKLGWELRSLVEEFRGVIRGLDEVNKEVEEVLGTGSDKGSDEGAGDANPVPTLKDALYFAPVLVTHFMIFTGTLFFFLLTRRSIYEWLCRAMGGTDKAQIRQRLQNAEQLVSRYVLTISVINLGLGASLAIVLWLIGMPAPLVWGVAATLLNFILYLGPLALMVGLFLAGLVAFNGAMVILPTLLFLTLNIVESQVVTPSLIGRHMSVNPLLVFVSLLFWLWLWGPIGGIIAIPVLVIALVMLDLFDGRLEQQAPGAAAPD